MPLEMMSLGLAKCVMNKPKVKEVKKYVRVERWVAYKREVAYPC